MNNDLLKKLSIATAIGLVLTACGGADEGISTGLGGTTPVQFDGPISISVNEESGEYVHDLLEGAIIGENETVVLRNIYRKDDPLVLPEVVVLPPDNAILVQGNRLIIDTDAFAREVGFGEELTFEYSYIIENGAGAQLDESGDEISRNIIVKIKGVKDAVEALTLSHSEVLVPPNFDLSISANITPVYATDQSVTWAIENTVFATVNANGVVTGIAEGTTTLTATSIDNPEAQVIVPLVVTFDIPNPIGMVLVNSKGVDVGNSLKIPECSSYSLSAQQLPLESGFTNPVTWMSSDESKIIVSDKGHLTIAVDSAASEPIIITATNDQGLSDQVNVTVVNNIACNSAANNNFDFTLVSAWPWDGGSNVTKSDSAEGVNSSNALHLQTEAGKVGRTRAVDWSGGNPLIPEIGAGVGKYYKVSFWVKNLGNSTTQVSLQAKAWVGSWHPDILDVSTPIAISDEWQYVEFEPIQDKDWDNSQVIWLEWIVPFSETASDVLIDDMAIYEVAAP